MTEPDKKPAPPLPVHPDDKPVAVRQGGSVTKPKPPEPEKTPEPAPAEAETEPKSKPKKGV